MRDMPSTLEAFTVGYSLNMVGAYFEGAQMIAHIGAGGDAELKEACEQQLQALAQGAAGTRWQIKRTTQAMAAAGLPEVEAPTTVDDYAGWSEVVSEAYYPKLEGNEQIAAYLFGWYLSAWIQYANMAVISMFLKDAAPDNATVAANLDELAGDLEEARQQFEAVLPDIPLPADALPHVKKCAELVQGTPPVNDPSQDLLDVADDFQEALYDLPGAVEELEKALG